MQIFRFIWIFYFFSFSSFEWLMNPNRSWKRRKNFHFKKLVLNQIWKFCFVFFVKPLFVSQLRQIFQVVWMKKICSQWLSRDLTDWFIMTWYMGAGILLSLSLRLFNGICLFLWMWESLIWLIAIIVFISNHSLALSFSMPAAI